MFGNKKETSPPVDLRQRSRDRLRTAQEIDAEVGHRTLRADQHRQGALKDRVAAIEERNGQ